MICQKSEKKKHAKELSPMISSEDWDFGEQPALETEPGEAPDRNSGGNRDRNSFLASGGLRKNFRKAVDERNLFYDDFKNQGAWTRFKWALRNPLAWMFGRSEKNQVKTIERQRRAEDIRALAGNLDWNLDPNSEPLEAGIDPVAQEARRRAYAGEGEYHPTSSGKLDSMAPKAAFGSMVGKTLTGGLRDVGTMEKDDLPGFLENMHNKMEGSAAQGAVQGLGLGFSLVNGLTDARSLYRKTNKAVENWNQTDKLAAAAKVIDAGTAGIGVEKNIGTFVQNALLLADKTGAGNIIGNQVIPGLDIAAGVTKSISAGLELARGSMIRSKATGLNKGFQEALKRAEADQAGKLRQQIGFMNMAHLTAKADQVRAGFKLAGGAMQAAGGAATLAAPIAGLGMGLKGAAMATELTGKAVSNNMRKGMMNKEVNRSLHLKEQMKQVMELAKDKQLTKSEAKHIVLARYGYNSRKEAYLDLARKRMARLEALRTGSEKDVATFDSMVHALNLDPSKMKGENGMAPFKTALFKRIGVSRKKSGNIGEAIQQERTRRKTPSWAR